MKEIIHGRSAYRHQKCRCEICKSEKAKYDAAYKSSPKGKLVHAKSDAKYQATPQGKAAHAKYNAKRNADPEGKLKQRARGFVRAAVCAGRMFRQSCLLCDNGPGEAHHWHGYDDQHACDVIWLCRVHHVD